MWNCENTELPVNPDFTLQNVKLKTEFNGWKLTIETNIWKLINMRFTPQNVKRKSMSFCVYNCKIHAK